MASREPRGQGRLRITNPGRGTVLAERAGRARGLVARTLGLMGTRALPAGGGLLLEGDNAVHTCFMRYPIDVAFLDGERRVVHVSPALRPWRVSPIVWRARAVLELPAGTLARTGTVVGDRLQVEGDG